MLICLCKMYERVFAKYSNYVIIATTYRGQHCADHLLEQSRSVAGTQNLMMVIRYRGQHCANHIMEQAM